jgi:hypothetical protein
LRPFQEKKNRGFGGSHGCRRSALSAHIRVIRGSLA